MNAAMISSFVPQSQVGVQRYEVGSARSHRGCVDDFRIHCSANFHVDSFVTRTVGGWFRGGMVGEEKDVF